MKKYIVVTSVNLKTIAISKFDEMKDWNLVVVGDKKTPTPYQLKNGHFMSCKEQEALYPKLSSILGWNNVDRRNLGFLYAYQQGADIVAMVDDDNIPYKDWGQNVVFDKSVEVKEYQTNNLVFDPLSVTSHSHLWHRGFPIHKVSLRKCHYEAYEIKTLKKKILVQADLWDGDPDTDAFNRMVYPNSNIVFNDPYKNKFSSNSMFCPFNMQNTFVARKALKDLISIPYTGRMCDIWGAYYFEALNPDSVVYGPASVLHIQKRSWASIIQDCKEEMEGHFFCQNILERLKENPDNIKLYLSDQRSLEFIHCYREFFED